MLKITAYADRLHRRSGRRGLTSTAGQDPADATGSAAATARRSTSPPPRATTLTVYTTRPDTLFGATYMVISPEHPCIEKVGGQASRTWTPCAPIRRRPPRKSDFERTELAKDKTGVRLEGVHGHQPRQRQRDPHLHLRLCAGHLRHRRHHGRARPRHPRLGFRQEVRPAHHRGGQAAATWRRRPSPTVPPA